MGFLTQVVIHNDILDNLKANKEEFASAVLNGVADASIKEDQVDVPFRNAFGYIQVEKPRHADHEVLFLCAGNRMIAVGDGKQWNELVRKNPDLAKELLKTAKRLIKKADGSLK